MNKIRLFSFLITFCFITNTFVVTQTFALDLTGLCVVSSVVIFKNIEASIKVKKSFKRGEEAIKNNNWEKAVKEFKKILKLKPNNVKARELFNQSSGELHYEKGMQFLKNGDTKQAFYEFQQVYKYYPQHDRLKNTVLSINLTNFFILLPSQIGILCGTETEDKKFGIK